MLFEEVYEEYKRYVQKRHKKQGFVTITQDFNNHVLPYFKGFNIKSITKIDVMNWQDKILDKNFSNKYNAKVYYVFSSFMKYCHCCSYIENNIVLEVGPFQKKIEKKSHVVYTIWQFRLFRFKLRNYIIKQYFNFMYFYGPRPSETMALRFSDKEKRIIHINHSIHRKGDRDLDTPKNQSSIRSFKISWLMCFRIWRLKRMYIKKYGDCDYDYFIFGGNKPLAPTTIDRHKKEAYKKAHLKAITQHEFRHSYATRMIHKKTPIDVVSRKLGHSRVSTTMDVYVHQEKKYT